MRKTIKLSDLHPGHQKNLGMKHYESGEYGRATYPFRRSLELMPPDFLLESRAETEHYLDLCLRRIGERARDSTDDNTPFRLPSFRTQRK